MKINRVTITGPDDKTNIQELVELTQKYPFVEWALLFSKNREGTQRYPSESWVSEVVKHGLPLSAHFCGNWAREVLEKQNFALIAFLENFQRVQLNYNFKHSKNWDLESFIMFCKYGLDFMRGTKLEKSVILQYNKSNSEVINQIKQVPKSVDFLYDASGGRGTVIKEIEPPILESYTGYAGGIGPENVGEICELITNHNSQDEVWIDMETAVRTENELDLSKVEEVLKISAKYIS